MWYYVNIKKGTKEQQAHWIKSNVLFLCLKEGEEIEYCTADS